MKSAEASHWKLIRTKWEDHRSWSSYKYTRSCRRTQRWPFYSCSAFERIGKVPQELTTNQKNCCSEVLSYSMQQQQTISQLDCDMRQKVNFIPPPVMTSSVVRLQRSSKALTKAKLTPKKGSWSLFGGLLRVWSTTAFWIPAKPFHPRRMLCTSMRCTENCNACCWHQSTERAQFYSMITPNRVFHNQRFKS